MSVQKIKSDLSMYGVYLNSCIGTTENALTSLNSYNIVNTTALFNALNALYANISMQDSFLTGLYSECSIELDIFFKSYNKELSKQKSENEKMYSVINEISAVASELYFLFLIDYHKGKCGGLLAKTDGKEVRRFSKDVRSFKSALQKLKEETEKHNSKLIVKGR